VVAAKEILTRYEKKFFPVEAVECWGRSPGTMRVRRFSKCSRPRKALRNLIQPANSEPLEWD